VRTIAATLAAAFAGVAVAGALIHGAGRQSDQALHVQAEVQKADFRLRDARGRITTPDSFPGRWLLVFFGFTHCPDVCPMTATTVARAVEALGQDAGLLQPVMISVDPDRDTPEALQRYLEFFHPRIAGLTGTKEEIDFAADRFRVHYAHATQEGSIDHTALLFLVDPERRFAAIYPPDTAAPVLANELRRMMQRSD
jgi:cytochrome oxidase Cu insertion factor (SCO1/SenC/PrrC family)